MSTISEDTPLLPEVIADAVCREAGELLKHAPADVRSHLCERAERHYQGAGGPAFAKRIRGKYGREALYSFMRHWLAAMLIEAGVCRCQLPYGWSNGATPMDCKPNLKD